MSSRSPSRRRALSLWLTLAPLALASAACLDIPDDFEEPDAAPAAPSTAQELLDRHIAASGGEEALRALDQRTVEARVVFKAEEDCEPGDESCMGEDKVGDFVLYNTADGRMYRRMVVDDNIIERGFDGKTGWQMQSQPQMLAIEDPSIEFVLREDALLHWYLDLEAREELALELLPTRKTEDGRELDGVVWLAGAPGLPQSEKWFDRSTGLLHEEVERDLDTGDLVRRVYSDYRDVDGVQVPWLIEQITEVQDYPPQVVELRIQSVRHREIKPELFAVPELGPTEPEPDELLLVLDETKRAAEEAPDDILAQMKLARVAYAAVHFEEASAAANRALALDKNELEAMFILARIAVLESRLQDADKLLRRASKAGLREDEVARQQAWIHLRRLEWDKAAQAFTRAGLPAIGQRYEVFSGKPLAAKMKGCEVTVPISVETGMIIVEVLADGETLSMLLDTSISDLIISDSQARSLVIGTDAEAPLATNGPPLRQGQLDALTIGEFSVSNVPVTMLPDENMGAVIGIEGVDGVLGIRTLAERQLTIDRDAKTMTLVEPSSRCAKARAAHHVGAAVPFLVHESHYIYLHAEMNGAEGIYLLNTGMRGADLTANEGAYAYAGIGAPPLRGNAPSLAHVEQFDIGEFNRRDLAAAWGFMQHNATIDGFRLDGMIGLGVLGTGSWTLDFQDQQLYLSKPAPKPVDPAEPQAPARPAEPAQ